MNFNLILMQMERKSGLDIVKSEKWNERGEKTTLNNRCMTFDKFAELSLFSVCFTLQETCFHVLCSIKSDIIIPKHL